MTMSAFANYAHATLSVRVPLLHGVAIVVPELANEFEILVGNDGDRLVSGSLDIILVSPSGRRIGVIRDELHLLPGRERRVAFSLAGEELGVWSVEYKFVSAYPVDSEDGRVRFALMDPVGPNDLQPQFHFGLVAHHERERDSFLRRKEIMAGALVGAKVIRSNPVWGDIQPQENMWEWDLMDDMLATYDELGLKMQMLLGYTVPWASRSGGGERSAPHADAWREYVTALVERYRGRIPLWEPWNEPDIGFWTGSIDEFIEIAGIAVDVIKDNDPSARVMSPGFTTLWWYPGRKRNPDMQKKVMEALGNRFDYHAAHEHGSYDRFAEALDTLYPKFREQLPIPVPPLFFNETAIHSVGGEKSELRQALVLVKKATYARSKGAEGYFWYELLDGGADKSNSEHNYGMLTADYQPKPVYAAYNSYARFVVPRPYIGALNGGEGKRLFVFGADPALNDENALLVFWNDDLATIGEQHLLWAPGATELQLIDINGNIVPVAQGEEGVVLNLMEQPQYLLAKGASVIEWRGALVSPVKSYFGGPGEALGVDVAFINPTNRNQTVNIDWGFPMAVDVIEVGSSPIQLHPSGEALSKSVVRLPEGDRYKFGDVLKLRVNYEYPELNYRGRLLIPIQLNTIDVNFGGIDPNKSADIDLRNKERLDSFIDSDPMMQAYHWNGPEDFSAQLWFGSDDGYLLLRVAVTDKKHHQVQQESELWRGDSVQVVISIPGDRGFWEFGFADHEINGAIWTEFSRPMSAASVASVPVVTISPYGDNGEGRLYEIAIPRTDIGLTDKVLAEGFRFNMAVNNSNGIYRTHAMEIVPGIVRHKTIDNIPYVVFRNSLGN